MSAPRNPIHQASHGGSLSSTEDLCEMTSGVELVVVERDFRSNSFYSKQVIPKESYSSSKS